MWVTLMPVMTTAVKLSRVASSAIRVLRQSSSSLMWELSPICHTHMANCHIHCHTYYQTQTENCRVSPPQLSEFWDSRRRLWELSPICHTHKANCHKYTVTHTVNCHSSLDKYGKQSPKCHLCSVLFFSRPRPEGWPRHRRTFSIYLCPLSFWLTLPWGVLSMSWCCPSRPFVVYLACVHLALFLSLSLSPGNSLVPRGVTCFDGV